MVRHRGKFYATAEVLSTSGGWATLLNQKMTMGCPTLVAPGFGATGWELDIRRTPPTAERFHGRVVCPVMTSKSHPSPKAGERVGQPHIGSGRKDGPAPTLSKPFSKSQPSKRSAEWDAATEAGALRGLLRLRQGIELRLAADAHRRRSTRLKLRHDPEERSDGLAPSLLFLSARLLWFKRNESVPPNIHSNRA